MDIIRNAELEFVGTVFEDDTLYEYDLNGQPTIAMPLDTPAVQAAFSIFDNLLS
jgi:CO dehydrogenase maturation factor